MPLTAAEATQTVEQIEAGDTTSVTFYQQPADLIKEGDWRPCQFFDPELVSAAMSLEQASNLVPLQDRYSLGPDGRAIRGVFKTVNDDAGDCQVFWGRSKDLHTTMEAFPEQNVRIENRPRAESCWNKAGNLLIASKFRTTSGKLLAIFSQKPSLGSMWVPVQARSLPIKEAKALCAWHNSTLGSLGFFLRRSFDLANPMFSQEALKQLRVPDFSEVDPFMLAAAYEEAKRMPVSSWKNATNDAMRDCVDRAAAQTVGIDIEAVRSWRAKISNEPSISNEKAK